jgi:hypothetical protein
MHPLVHYVAYGAAEGRDPNPLFDTDWYLAQYPDVRGSALNPLAHYLKYGAAEGRNPSPLFDTGWYEATNPDVARSGLNPLVHYLDYGAAEGRAPASRRTERRRERHAVRSKYDVVVLANIEWKARWQRPQQLATQFARNGHRVFYVVSHPNIPDGASYDAMPVDDGIVQVRFPQSCSFDHYRGAVSGAPLRKNARRPRLAGGRLRHRGCDGSTCISPHGARSRCRCASAGAGPSSTTAWTNGTAFRISAPTCLRPRTSWCALRTP